MKDFPLLDYHISERSRDVETFVSLPIIQSSLDFTKSTHGASITVSLNALQAYANVTKIDCFQLLERQIPEVSNLLQRLTHENGRTCSYGTRILGDGRSVFIEGSLSLFDEKKFIYIEADKNFINTMGRINKGKDIISEMVVKLIHKKELSSLVYNFTIMEFTLKSNGYKFKRTHFEKNTFKPLDAASNEDKALKNQCHEGDGRACYSIGYKYNKENNYKDAAAYFDQACKMKFGLGCYVLGLFSLRGDGIVKNDENAINYFNLSCENDYAKGCYVMGTESTNSGSYFEKSRKRRKKYIRKACTLRSEEACKHLIYTKAVIHTIRAKTMD